MERDKWEALVIEEAGKSGPNWIDSLKLTRADVRAIARSIIRDRIEAARWSSLSEDDRKAELLARAKARLDFARADARDYPEEWASERDRRMFVSDEVRRYDEAVDRLS